ncbi:MAG: glycosyltransferase family 2 protein [Bryobacteraceae bacterium]
MRPSESDSAIRLWNSRRTAHLASGATRKPDRIESLTILMPVYNDWACAERLLPLIDAELRGIAADVRVLLIDDGSNTPASPDLAETLFQSIREVRVLRLRGNLGHQRAIAIGLYYVHQFLPTDVLVVMDGDGEDRPSDIPALLAGLNAAGGREMVFAARTKRLERPAFRFFYRVYRAVHRILTGIPVRVGNFSVVPRPALDRLMISSDLWNHYAAAAFRSKLPYRTVPLERGARLDGKSRMNFFALVVHGLSAISVFADVVSVRLLVGAAGFLFSSLLVLAAVASARFALPNAMPAWATIAAGSLAVFGLQAMLLSLVLVLAIISARSNTSFIPLRDSEYYILEQKLLWEQHEPANLCRSRVDAI